MSKQRGRVRPWMQAHSLLRAKALVFNLINNFLLEPGGQCGCPIWFARLALPWQYHLSYSGLLFQIQTCTMTDLLSYNFLVSIKMQTIKLACWISINDYLFEFALLDYDFEIDFLGTEIIK
jgi:hypothetical protein